MLLIVGDIMKIAIYSRKSKFTGKGESIENQIEMCKKYISIHFDKNYKLLTYEDEGFSGSTIERPNFKLMLEDAKLKKFDVLVCYRLDRISRNISDFSILISKLKNYNIAFVSIKEQFDTTTPLGRAMMYISGVFAQLERETISERVRDNLRQLAKTGRWLGGVTPIGFISEEVIVKDNNGKLKEYKKLSSVEEEISTVKVIYSKFLELKSLTKTETYLINYGYKSRNNIFFSRSAIKNILSNPVYAIADEELYTYFIQNKYSVCCDKNLFNGYNGVMAYNKTSQVESKTKVRHTSEWIISIGNHEGIIESYTWIKVNKLLIQNKSKNYRKVKNTECLLSGILLCGNCKSYMRPKYGRYNSEGKKIYYYMCELKEKSKRVKCNIKNAPGINLDLWVCQTIKSLSTNTSDILKEINTEKLKFKSHTSKTLREIYSIKETIKSKEIYISNLVSAISKGNESCSRDYLIKEIARLHNEISRLKEILSELNKKFNIIKEDNNSITLIDEMIKSFENTFENLTLYNKRNFIKGLTKSIIWDGTNTDIILFS